MIKNSEAKLGADVKQDLISPSAMRPAPQAALSRLLRAGIFALRYQDLDGAIDDINRLAMKGN